MNNIIFEDQNVFNSNNNLDEDNIKLLGLKKTFKLLIKILEDNFFNIVLLLFLLSLMEILNNTLSVFYLYEVLDIDIAIFEKSRLMQKTYLDNFIRNNLFGAFIFMFMDLTIKFIIIAISTLFIKSAVYDYCVHNKKTNFKNAFFRFKGRIFKFILTDIAFTIFVIVPFFLFSFFITIPIFINIGVNVLNYDDDIIMNMLKVFNVFYTILSFISIYLKLIFIFKSDFVLFFDTRISTAFSKAFKMVKGSKLYFFIMGICVHLVFFAIKIVFEIIKEILYSFNWNFSLPSGNLGIMLTNIPAKTIDCIHDVSFNLIIVSIITIRFLNILYKNNKESDINNNLHQVK